MSIQNIHNYSCVVKKGISYISSLPCPVLATGIGGGPRSIAGGWGYSKKPYPTIKTISLFPFSSLPLFLFIKKYERQTFRIVCPTLGVGFIQPISTISASKPLI